ncbi:MAG TPA: SDR family NAD(P)-dependent oxidoreductase [Rhizomicrobium sp.]|jgi:NAD(P)-dependent dehydrogenase (short-subunit alcohol dehydrogenase family)|nr:SDR family NAD(P)-dependent oxidoreductase [Rhizomicrobium sp.]
MKSVVVTGSSTGIGWGATKVLIEKGFRVFGSVRKEADGERLKSAFGAMFSPLYFDVTDATAVNAAAEQVSAALRGDTLAGLVNNAGVAVAGPLLYLKIDELRRQLEVNVTGQVIATQAFAPLLGADRSRKGAPGRIIMISSVGGRNANPFMGPYNASKFAIEGLSESLRRELMLFGVDVIVIAPGAVATAIWDKAEELDISQYANTPYLKPLERIRAYMLDRGPKGLKPEELGFAIHHALTAPRPRVRYTVTPDPLQEVAQAVLPRRFMDRMIARRLGLTRTR